MKLLNVRLGPQHARMAARLRKDGIPISRVVRDAIRAAYSRRAVAGIGRRRASEVMAEIYREHPDPPNVSRARRGRRQRRGVQALIRAKLRRQAR